MFNKNTVKFRSNALLGTEEKKRYSREKKMEKKLFQNINTLYYLDGKIFMNFFLFGTN